MYGELDDRWGAKFCSDNKELMPYKGVDSTPYILKSKYDELLKEKEELEKENEWISVEDKLPSINEDVLGFGIDEGIKVWDFCSATKNGFKMQSSINRNVNITHWKPLPKAPIIKPTEK